MTLRYNRLKNSISIVTRARLNRNSASLPYKDLEVVSVALKAMERYLEGLGENAPNANDPVDWMSPQDLYDRETGTYERVHVGTPLWVPTRINQSWSEWRVHVGDERPVPPGITVRYIRKSTALTSEHILPEHAVNVSASARSSSLSWTQFGSPEDILYYCVKEA